MLVYDQTVQDIARRAAFEEPVRYLAPRWAELLDPATHYSRAGASLVDPLTAVREYGATADGFLNLDGTHYGAVIEWSRRLKVVLRSERNCRHWFPSEHGQLVARLGNLLNSIPNHAAPQSKEAEVRRRARRIMRQELPAFEARLASAQDGYAVRLLDQVCDTVLALPAGNQDWERYDSDLAYLASFVLAQGRDALRVCEECLSAMSSAATGSDAMRAFRAVLTRGQTRYHVALILQGAGSAPTAAAFGCTELTQGWPNGTPASNRRLRDFINKRVGRAAALLVETDAFDVEQARAIAISRAEELQDHILAEHRLSEVRIRHEVLVQCQTTGDISTVSRSRNSVETARTLAPAPVAAIQSSLRFYGEARQEHANVMSVVQFWVALEALAEGAQVLKQDGTWKAQPAGAYVPAHASTVMALTSAKSMVSNLWQLLRGFARTHHPDRWRELERWLELAPGRKHVDLQRWCELLVAADGMTTAPPILVPGASVSEAAAVLREIATDLGPFPLRRLVEIRGRLTNGLLLSNWLASLRATAEISLMRMKFMRHRAMHHAQFESHSALQVRQAAHDILDCVYEVLPRWLPSRNAPWEVFRDARTRYEGLLAIWSGPGSMPSFDPKLSDP